jgi:hypothetical protein
LIAHKKLLQLRISFASSEPRVQKHYFSKGQAPLVEGNNRRCLIHSVQLFHNEPNSVGHF